MGLVLLVVLICLMVGALPELGYTRFGYGPSSVAGVLLIVIIALLLTGRL